MAAKARPDSVSNAVGDGVSSLTWAHTIIGGSHRFLLVAVTQGDNTVSGVTYAGVSMSLIGTKTHSVATSHRTSLYGLVAPARGANNIVVTFGGSTSNVICGAIGYNFVDQSTPTDGFVGADGEGETTIACTVMSRDGDSVVAAFRGDSSASGYTPNGTSQWLRDDGVPYNYGGGQTRDGADGSPGVVLAWSSAPYVKWTMAGCNIRATSDTLALAVVLEEESTSDNTSYTTSGSVPAIASDEVLIVDVINGAYSVGSEQITDIQLSHNASPAGSFTQEYFSGYGPSGNAVSAFARFYLAGPADAGTLGIDVSVNTGNAMGYSIIASKVLGLDTADPIAQSVFTSSDGAASPNTMLVSIGSPGGLTDASNPTYGALISDNPIAVALDSNWDIEVGELYNGDSGVLHVAFTTPGRESLSSTTDMGDFSDWAGLLSELNLAGGAPSGITADLSQTLGTIQHFRRNQCDCCRACANARRCISQCRRSQRVGCRSGPDVG